MKQRQNNQSVQQALLSALARRGIAVHALYRYVPFLALEVDSAALDILVSSLLVTSIREDLSVPPTLASSILVIGAGSPACNTVRNSVEPRSSPARLFRQIKGQRKATHRDDAVRREWSVLERPSAKSVTGTI